MDSPLKFVLPAALVVTTFAIAGACNDRTEYCEDIEKKSKCESEAGCGWDEDQGHCINTCFEIEDQQQCEAIERCEWDAGFSTEDETGGEGYSCHEPFT